MKLLRLCVASLVYLLVQGSATPQAKPNIVILFADDVSAVGYDVKLL